MKDMTKILDFKIRIAIIFNSLNGRKLTFVNPFHEFLRAISFVGNFLVKESMFSTLDCLLKLFPILNIFSLPVLLKVSVIICIPPTLGMLGNVDNL